MADRCTVFNDAMKAAMEAYKTKIVERKDRRFWRRENISDNIIQARFQYLGSKIMENNPNIILSSEHFNIYSNEIHKIFQSYVYGEEVGWVRGNPNLNNNNKYVVLGEENSEFEKYNLDKLTLNISEKVTLGDYEIEIPAGGFFKTDAQGNTVNKTFREIIEEYVVPVIEKQKTAIEIRIKESKGLATESDAWNYNNLIYRNGVYPLMVLYQRLNEEEFVGLAQKIEGRLLYDGNDTDFANMARAISNILMGQDSSAKNIKGGKEFKIPENLAPAFTTEEGKLENTDVLDKVFTPLQRFQEVNFVHKVFQDMLKQSKDIAKAMLERELQNVSALNMTDAQKAARTKTLQSKIDNLTIAEAINTIGIKAFVNNIFSFYQNLVNCTEQQRVQYIYDNLVANANNSEEWDAKKQWEIATIYATEAYREYSEIVNDVNVFNALVREALVKLRRTDKIVINYHSDNDALSTASSDNQNDDNEIADIEQHKEDHDRDNWIDDVRTISAHSKLSEEVKEFFRGIAKTDLHNNLIRSETGEIQYYDESYVHRELLVALKNINSIEDMMPAIEKLARSKPWAKQILAQFEVLKSPITPENEKNWHKMEQLKTKMYCNLRLDFVPFYIQKQVRNADGTYSYITMPLNIHEGEEYLVDSWRDAVDNKIILNADYSIYKENGEINVTNKDKLIKIVENLKSFYVGGSPKERAEKLKQKLPSGKTIAEELIPVFQGIGIDIDPYIVEKSIEFNPEEIKNGKTTPVDTIIRHVSWILTNLKSSEEKVSGGMKSMFTNASSSYLGLAKLFSKYTEQMVESSVYQNGVRNYSHVAPGYLTKLVKALKLRAVDKKAFEKYIYREFQQYEWFYDPADTEHPWKNDILANLMDEENGDEYAEKLSHQVLLSLGDKDYADWSEAERLIVLWNNYNSDPTGEYMFSPVPVLADAGSSEALRVRKYTTKNAKNTGSTQDTFETLLLPKFKELVKQEFGRIMIQRERCKLFQSGALSINEFMTNYDVESMEKAGFTFLPELNNMQVETSSGEKMSFIQALENLVKTAKDINKPVGERKEAEIELDSIITSTLKEVLDGEFEKSFQRWINIGAFEEVQIEDSKKGVTHKSKHFEHTLSVNNEDIEFALNTIKEMSKDTESETVVNTALDKLKKNRNLTLKELKEVYDSISKTGILGDLKQFKAKSFDRVVKALTQYSTMKEDFREFFWNSSYATSQIMQITAVDLSYYKGLDDFQKRYKEMHSSYKQLDTEATWKGEKVGRKYETSLLLKDSMTRSKICEELAEMLQQQIRDGKVNPASAVSMLASFGYANATIKNSKGEDVAVTLLHDNEGNAITAKPTKINVADAQAFRSPTSYRRVMIMAGEWSDEFEEAYEALLDKNNTDLSVLDVIWQTKKPFYFGYHKQSFTTKDERGFEVTHNLKVPAQHKNSEFLLLAAYTKVARSMGKSNKLTAISDFMESHDIDLVQFESASKTTKQAVINLTEIRDDSGELKKVETRNAKRLGEGIETSFVKTIEETESLFGLTDESLINEYLESITGLTRGQTLDQEAWDEYQNDESGIRPDFGKQGVVSITSFSDYGIQVATPEHLLDNEAQLLGSQIKKLIMADLDPNATYVIGKHTFTKDQLVLHYNNIITAKIVKKFKEVSDAFDSPRAIQKALLDELHSSSQYDADLEKALQLDENGNFALPLFEPVQSARVQKFMYSMIKNRVSRLKQPGGTGIQVSVFGNDNLNIIYKNNKGDEISFEWYKKHYNEDGTKEEYYSWRKEAIENKELSIAAYECYVGAYTKDFFEIYADDKGNIDMTKIPKNLLEMIGYRVPTEDKYSMAPLRIKGFLPSQNGSAIMLPAEITLLSGSDFDVDKMYLIRPDFKRVNSYNWEGIITEITDANGREEFSKENIDALISKIYKEMDARNLIRDSATEREYNKIVKEFNDLQSGSTLEEITKDPHYEKKRKAFQRKVVMLYLREEYDSDNYNEMPEELKQMLDAVADKSQYMQKTALKKVNYNYKKDALRQNTKQLNNGILDAMWSVLTNPATVYSMMNPGGFEPQKRSNKIISILSNAIGDTLFLSTEEAEKSPFIKRIYEYAKIANIEIPDRHIVLRTAKSAQTKLAKTPYAYDVYRNVHYILSHVNDDVINALYKETQIPLNPLSPDTQIILQHRNMVGKQLVGIFANQNSIQALLQHTNITISDAFAFTLGGKQLTSLHEVKIDYEYVTRLVSGYLAAAVDNGKDPVLGGMGVNQFTAGIAGLLARLGYGPEEVGIFLAQPAVREIVLEASKKDYFGGDKEAVKEVIDRYWNKAEAVVGKLSKSDKGMYKARTNQVPFDMMATDILASKAIDNISTEELKKLKMEDPLKGYYIRQARVAMLFSHLQKISEALGHIGNAFKSDSSNLAGPTFGDTFNTLDKVSTYFQEVGKKIRVFEGLDNILQMNIGEERDPFGLDILGEHEDLAQYLFDKFKDQKIGYMGAYYHLGVRQANVLMSKYFPEVREFLPVIRYIKQMTGRDTLTPELYNKIFNGLYTYICSDLPFFGSGTAFNERGEEVEITAQDRKEAFINYFPAYFRKLKNEVPELQEFEFVKQLVIEKASERNPVAVVKFKRVGGLNDTDLNKYRKEWAALLYSSDKRVRDLGWNLIRYSFFRSGFGFGPESFMHLCPVEARMAIPGYREKLKTIQGNYNDAVEIAKREGKQVTVRDTLYGNFIEQFVRNNLDEPALIKTCSYKEIQNCMYGTRTVSSTPNSGNDVPSRKGTELLLSLNPLDGSGLPAYSNGKEPALYIKYKVNDTIVYFELTEYDTENSLVVYTQIEPLGIPNQFVEYDSSVNYLRSVIKANKIKDISEDAEEDSQITHLQKQADLLERLEALDALEEFYSNSGTEGESNESVDIHALNANKSVENKTCKSAKKPKK